MTRARLWDDMDEQQDNKARETLAALWRGIRPALPVVIGAAALTFLFVAVMPLAWVAAISWQLYLDRLSDFFLPPIGNAGRLGLATAMAMLAALLTLLVTLLIRKPATRGESRGRRRVSVPGRMQAAADAVLPRRRADRHPDDAPRPPIRAGSDLPKGGLGPLTPAVTDESDAVDLATVDLADDEDELILADLAPVDYSADDSEAPWLQPAEVAKPAMPEPVDNSLGAMVARFEAGLTQRRASAVTANADVARDIEQPDFALEAALSTLQRLNRRAVG